MASAADAEIVLKLYGLRRDQRMRAARNWVMHEFNPRSLDELLAVQRDFGSEHNQYWRQVIGYWEMASALVLRGALDNDLFLDCNGENLYLFAKFGRLHEEFARMVPGGFMPHTAEVIGKNATARERALALRAFLEARIGGP